MSRASSLAKALRDLKDERDEVSERKAAYDHDVNRAIVALSRFTKIVERESSPDIRRPVGEQNPPESSHPPPPPPPLEEDEATGEIPADSTPGWAKKAYRMIALKTHPDRIGNDERLTDNQRERLISLYREATSAYHEKKYESLAEVAAELEIEVEIPTAELERALESKIRSIRDEIEGSQKTISWHWGISFGDTQKRIQVLHACCRVMQIPTPDDDVLKDIIVKLESEPEFDIVDRLGRVRRIKSGAERRKLGTRPEKRIR